MNPVAPCSRAAQWPRLQGKRRAFCAERRICKRQEFNLEPCTKGSVSQKPSKNRVVDAECRARGGTNRALETDGVNISMGGSQQGLAIPRYIWQLWGQSMHTECWCSLVTCIQSGPAASRRGLFLPRFPPCAFWSAARAVSSHAGGAGNREGSLFSAAARAGEMRLFDYPGRRRCRRWAAARSL